MLAFRIIGDFGAIIAVPVILFVLVAQWVEGKYGGEPWLTILAFVLAGLLTAKMIIKKAKEYGKKYEEIGKSSNTDTRINANVADNADKNTTHPRN